MANGTVNDDGIFECFGNKYIFRVELYSNNIERSSLTLQLNAANVKLFRYASSVNQLCMDGEIVYVDINGDVDKFIHKHFCYCKVVLIHINPDTDYDPIRDSSMWHLFHVVNIEILNRAGHEITYKLKLVSANWWKCNSNLVFSNYGSKPESIIQLMKKLLVQKKLVVDEDSFSKVVTQVKMNYIANGNDNLFTSIPYLLARQFYFSKRDNSIKFVCYDNIFDKYYMLDLNNPDTLKSAETQMVSMFNSNHENVLNSYSSNFATVVRFPFTQVFNALKDIDAYDYNFQKNKFVEKPIKEAELLQYYNKHFDLTDTSEKFERRFQTEIPYITRTAYWANDRLQQMYQNAVDTLLGYNGLIINVPGNIVRKPGTSIIMNVDRTSTTQNDNIDVMQKKYKSIEGVWIVLKTVTYVQPNEETSKRLTQNLIMTRNFVYDDIDDNVKL